MAYIVLDAICACDSSEPSHASPELAKRGENMLFSFPWHRSLLHQQAVDGAISHHHGW